MYDKFFILMNSASKLGSRLPTAYPGEKRICERSLGCGRIEHKAWNNFAKSIPAKKYGVRTRCTIMMP